MPHLKRRLEIAFTLTCVLGLIIVVWVVSAGATAAGSNGGYPDPYPGYPSLYLPVINNEYAAPTATPTPSPTPTPLPSPTPSPTPTATLSPYP